MVWPHAPTCSRVSDVAEGSCSPFMDLTPFHWAWAGRWEVELPPRAQQHAVLSPGNQGLILLVRLVGQASGIRLVSPWP